MKIVMLCNIIVKSVFAICVTVAAICFGRVIQLRDKYIAKMKGGAE